jgi:hypothetical protein
VQPIPLRARATLQNPDWGPLVSGKEQGTRCRAVVSPDRWAVGQPSPTCWTGTAPLSLSPPPIRRKKLAEASFPIVVSPPTSRWEPPSLIDDQPLIGPATRQFLLHRWSSLPCAPFALGFRIIGPLLWPPPRITWVTSTAASELSFHASRHWLEIA